MLSIGKLGRGQERYYLDKVAEGAEDYYSGEGEAVGYWLGDAAAELGLQGAVDPEQLVAMLTGNSPLDGSPLLSMRGVRGEGPVPGFDLTFSAPKSVSLTWALGDPATASNVIAAHEQSLKAALGYLQREACWTRRGAGGAEFVPGNGFLAAAYRHRSSRAGDPQLHTHVLIANATQGPDGRWTRLYHPAIYEHATTASYIYQANLRHELSWRLGVEWQPTRKGIAEIEGFADEQLRSFSKRRGQILEAAGGTESSARARAVANLLTREAKSDTGLSTATLRGRWAEQATKVGLDREAVERSFGQGEPARTVLSVEQLDHAVSAHSSHFDRRDAIQAVANSLPRGAPAAEVEQLADAFLASEAVIKISESAKGERFTTRRIWELERAALQTAERLGASEDRARVPELALERLLAARPSLKPDQEQMVRRLLSGGEGISIVIGEAGTGKTYATLSAAEGWGRQGIALSAAAPTWRAANVLGAEGLKATSIARLLGELERAEAQGRLALPRGSVLLIDEAGMVDSATLARLLDHADRAKAKLVLIGDPAQLGEIEAGGLFAALAERSKPIVLDEVIRQRHEAEREGAKLIRVGEGTDALSVYRSAERVVVAPDAAARREAMVADWAESFGGGEDALMVVKRNAEVDRLNELARMRMREQGRLGDVEIQVGENMFAVGDLLITRVNDHKAAIYNRERWRVAEVDAQARRVVLDGIDTQRRVCVDSVFLERVNPRDGAPALQHAYAATTYCAQGTTVDRAFVCVDASMDRQELYVAVSRSRSETLIYATPEVGMIGREEYAPASAQERGALETISAAAGRDRAQLAAHEEALRTELRGLPNEELLAWRAGLQGELGHQARQRERQLELAPMIEIAQGQHESAIARLREVPEAPRAQRKRELARASEREAQCRATLERLREEERRIGPLASRAPQEAAAIEAVLAERRSLAITAARVSPPRYISAELGQRPGDPAKRRAWDRGVEAIERYRQEHGIGDSERAFGAEPKDGRERATWNAQRRRLAERQRQLGLGHGIESRSRSRGLEIGI